MSQYGRSAAALKIVWGERTFLKFSAAPAHEYTDQAKVISLKNGNSTDFTETC